jgi:PEGA domain
MDSSSDVVPAELRLEAKPSAVRAYSRTFIGWTIWRERPSTPGGPSNTWFAVMATAAFTSAGISLLTLWLSSPGQTAGIDSVPTVGVWYEPLESISTERDALEAAASPDARDRPGSAARAARRAGVPAPARTANVRADRIVITQPAGARVTVNGVGYGATPLSIPHLPPGARRIRVSKAGYRSQERSVSADGITVRIDLPAQRAR